MKRRNIAFTVFCLLLAVSSLAGCKKEDAAEGIKYTKHDDINGYLCEDGSLVVDPGLCESAEAEPRMALDASDPELDAQPEMVPVSSVAAVVSSAQDAAKVFEDYAQAKGLDYEVVSSELAKVEDGVSYYRVRYSHDEVSGGRRNMLVDSTGRVFMEVGLA